MLIHLIKRLHEDEGAVAGQLIFSFLRDGPALRTIVVHNTVVSRDGLQLNLYFTFG